MMWGYGQNLWWMWLWGLLLLVGLALLVLLAVRVFGGTGHGPAPGRPGPYGQPGVPGPPGNTPGARSPARLILDERFARGELSAEQYRDYIRELGEGT